MRALVAGGAGFVGSHLCEFLLEQSIDVACVDNLSTGRRRNISYLLNRKGFGFVKADIAGRMNLRGEFDIIYNLASPASPKDYLALPLATLSVGSAGTRNLLELARRRKAVFVMASTSEVYGDPKQHPQRETYWGNVNPVGIRAVYDEAKRFSEALTVTYHRQYGMPVRIARIFNTYGPRMQTQDGRVVPNLIDQALNDQPMTIYGSGRQTRSFCYVSDLVEGLFRLAGCTDPMPVNLGNPDEYSILRLARVIRRLTGTRSKLQFRSLPQDDPKRRKPDITRARRLLKWKPKVPLEQGLEQTVAWFRKTRR